MRKCPDGVNSLERTAAMAPKKRPQKFFADQWSRCNICGVLIRATKRQLGEPEVDRVYRGRAACSAHDKEKLPSVCDMVRLESEMDKYNQHLANTTGNRGTRMLSRATLAVPGPRQEVHRRWV